MNGDPDPQEPRTGGVRVYRTSLAPECDGYGYFEGDGSEFPNTPAEPGTWFPLAEAESLIDPNDPAVRERLRRWLVYDMEWIPPHEKLVLESLLAALRSKP